LRRVSGRAPIVDGQPSIVVLIPAVEPKSPSEAGVGVMDQALLTFLPATLFVRTGQATEFRNSDDVLHNVNVKDEDTKTQAFNVAIPTGEKYTYTFAKDGFYGARCDIHPSMWALIVATASPYAAQTDSTGAFSFENVEAGAYTVRVYAGSQKLEQAIDVTAGDAEANFAPK
jgi:plastocyanin